jgi:RNA polymerase sigma-70 factor (ECF subfamily)
MDEAALCRQFAPRIRLYGLKHLRDEDRARDLVQGVLVIVIEALRAGRVEDLERLDRYVLGTCRHVVQRMRHEGARAEPTDGAVFEALAALPAIDTVDHAALFRCMGHLEARARTILLMSFYRERSADEIAGAMNLSAGNVRVVRHRALAQLRDCLGAAS